MKTPIANLSKAERFSLYRSALKICKSGYPLKGMASFGLCMMLPCMHWDIKPTDLNPETGGTWDWRSSEKWFPEIAQWVEYYYSMEEESRATNAKKPRIHFLETLLLECENEK